MQLDEIGRNKGRRRQADVQNLMCLSDKFCPFSQHNNILFAFELFTLSCEL